ncbi:hypothetical protein D9M68_789190 [compost metagenome]
MTQVAQLLRPQAALAVGLDEVGDGRVHEHGHVAEHVVEHVGLFEVVQLVRLADEVARREAAVGQVVEEHVVGHQARHGHHLPAGARHQHLGEVAKVGDFIGANGQVAHALHELVAGAPRQQLRLALIQRLPGGVVGGGVVLPALRDGPVGVLGAASVTGGQAVFGCGGVGQHLSLRCA